MIMILEGSYNHLANSAGMGCIIINKSGPVKTGQIKAIHVGSLRHCWCYKLVVQDSKCKMQK